MNRKKVFSYFMWFIYSMMLCVALLGVTGRLSKQAGYSDAVGYGISAVWLILCGLIVLLIHKLVAEAMEKDMSGKMSLLVSEGLAVVILFVVGIVLRIGGMFGAGDAAAYYELAKVTDGGTIAPVSHAAVYLYIQLLHLIYVIFGNVFVAGIWLQLVLQMIAGFFFYRAVRKMSGVIASFIALAFVMAGPMMTDASLSLSPELLFLAIYSFVLYICVGCIRGRKSPVSCLLTGVLIAVVCYLDVMGITLLLMTVAGILVKKSEEDRTLSGRLVGMLLCVLGTGAGFALTVLVNSLVNGNGFADVASNWWTVYSPSAFELPKMLDVSSMTTEIMCLLLVMTLGIFSYWCNFSKERQSLWIWLAIAQALLLCFGMNTIELDGGLNLYMSFAALAGVGIAGIFTPNREEMKEEESDEDIMAEEEALVMEQVAKAEEPVKAEEVAPKAEEPVKAEEVVPKEKETTEEAPKVKFIENPLPLPKKHVKKVLDYDLYVDAEQDDFDLAVDEDDDYDI